MFKDSTMAKWYDIVEVVAWVVYAATFVWFLLTDANAAVNANLLAAAWAFPMQSIAPIGICRNYGGCNDRHNLLE